MTLFNVPIMPLIRSLVGPRAYQVRPAEDGWMITERGSTLPVQMFAKKLEAVNAAKKMAREKQTHLDIFTRQGDLQTTIRFQ